MLRSVGRPLLLVTVVVAVLVAVALISSNALVDPRPVQQTELASPPESERVRLHAPKALVKANPEDGRPNATVLIVRVTIDGTPAAAAVEVRPGGLTDGQGGILAGFFAERAGSGPASNVEYVRTDADGIARVVGLSTGRWHVLARGADSVEGAAVASLVAAGQEAEVSIALRAGAHALHGRLVGPGGAPFVGDLALQAGGEGAARAVETVDGAFRFERLPAGRYRILAAVPGHLSWRSAWIVVPRAGALDLSMALAVALHGRVVSEADGTPIPGATVAVRVGTVREGERLRTRSTTGPDGTFAVRVEDAARVSVSAAGFASAAASWKRGMRDDAPFEIALAAPGRVSGRVVRARDGSPVSGVRIRLRRGGGTSGSVPGRMVESAADGTFAIDGLAPGEYDIFVLGGGWASDALASMSRDEHEPLRVLVDGDEIADIELRVVTTATLACRVTEPDGAPVVGAVVVATPSTWHLGGRWPSTVAVLTDAHGVARVADMPAGIQHTMHIRAVDGRSAQLTAMPTDDPAVPPLEIPLDALRSVLVRVVDADGGEPVPGAQVTVEDEERTAWWFGYPSAITGKDGTATLRPATGGDARIDVAVRGCLVAVWTEAPADIEEPWEVEVRVPRGRTTIGWVLRPDCEPAARIDIEVRDPYASGDSEPLLRTRTGSDGAFVVAGIALETVALRVTGLVDGVPHSGGWEVPRSQTEVEYVLGAVSDSEEQNDAVVVRVVGPDGESVDSARCRLERHGDDGTTYSRHSVERGSVRIWIDIHPGATNALHITEPRDALGRPLPLAGSTFDIPPATRGELEVRLEPERVIEGRVTDEEGHPISGVRVAAHVFAERLDDGHAEIGGVSARGDAIGGAVTGRDGSYRVGWLAAGDHVLVVSGPPEYVAPDPARVAAGGRYDVVMVAGVRAVLRVLDPSGKPVAKARVRIHSARGLHSSYVTDVAGDAFAARLERGAEYRVDVTPPDSVRLVAKTIDRWIPRDTTITLAEGLSISGVVVDEDGRSLPTGAVWQQKNGRPRDGDRLAIIGRDGTFEFEDLPAGAILTLRAEVGDVRGTTQEVAAGTRGVRLVVSLGPRIVVTLTGEFFGWVSVVALGPDGRVRTDNCYGGVAVLPGLDVGARYTVLVGPTDEGDYAVRRSVMPGAKPLEITMVRGEQIAGRVEGLPAGASVDVVADGPDGFRLTATTSEDGSFRIIGLAPGTWRLRAQREFDGVTLRAEAHAESGAKDVVLTLR